jgi:glycosyltransferase involved in cell wall biosynthesis
MSVISTGPGRISCGRESRRSRFRHTVLNVDNRTVDVSVVVCTYNRAKVLKQALVYLEASAARTNAAVEIVIVDNNSRDDTRAVIAVATLNSSVPVRYVLETQQGLSFARNRGIQESKGTVIAFTDDDCIVDPNWINALWREFVASLDVAVLGGRVDLYSPEDQPVSIRPLTNRVRYTDVGQIYGLIIGCNLAVRRDAVKLIGRFDPALGGTKGVTADDIEFVYRALRRGLGVVYAPEPRVFHNHGRRFPKELKALARSYTRGRGAFFCKYILKGDRAILRHAWWELRAQLNAGLPKTGELSRRESLQALASGALHFILTRASIVRP